MRYSTLLVEAPPQSVVAFWGVSVLTTRRIVQNNSTSKKPVCYTRHVRTLLMAFPLSDFNGLSRLKADVIC